MNVAERSRPVMPLSRPNHDTSREGLQTMRELDDALTRSFRFTRPERRILSRLIAGESVEAIARARQIRVTSVHKHMHRIFAKTNTNGRQPLLKLAFRLAARRRIMGPALAFAA